MSTILSMVLSTLPTEGEYVNFATPAISDPHDVKYMPLGLLSLATNICGIAQPVILDPITDGWDIATTAQKINELDMEVVGFSAVSRRVYSLYKLLEITKTRPGGWKIVGGPHATYHAQEILDHGADTVFVGQLAEHELYKWCLNPRKGIIQCNSDINEIAHPRRKILTDYEKYFYTGEKIFFKSIKRMHMFSSVGCPNACTFCSVQSHSVQRKRADLVLGEMWHLKSLGAESIHFMDDNMNTSAKHVAGILNEMEATGWSTEWSIRGQVKFDLSLVPRMKKNGMKRIHVGIESFNDESLKMFNKSHRKKDIEDFCRVMKENDVEVLAYIIIGVPGETEEYLDRMPETIRGLGIKHPFINVLYNMPDTELTNRDEKFKKMWEDYFKNPVPNFVVPHPNGEDYKAMILNRAERIIKEFTGL